VRAASARAADGTCQPIAASEIDRQWEYYKSLSDAREIASDDKYQCIHVESINAVVCRTTSANPAHSSIVIRTVVQDKNGVTLRTEADTAAKCGAFLEMMAQFQKLNRETIEDTQKRSQPGR
jgi:hypothetical protein